MARTIPLGEVGRELEKVLSQAVDSYQKELDVNLTSVLKVIADDFANKLKQVTPYAPNNKSIYGHLVDNIRIRKKSRKGKTHFEVDFGDKGFLATFLEFGVEYKNGNSMKRPFVRKCWDENKEQYFKRIISAVKGVS